MSNNDFCMMCGNSLDPKIHITKFGKSSKEMVEIQIQLLRTFIRGLHYQVPPESTFNGPGILESLMGDLDTYE